MANSMRNSLQFLTLGVFLALSLSVSGACKPVPSDAGATAIKPAGPAAPALTMGGKDAARSAAAAKNKNAVALGNAKIKDAVGTPVAKHKDALAPAAAKIGDAVGVPVPKNKDVSGTVAAKSKDAVAVKHKSVTTPSHRMLVPPPPPEMPFVGADERQSLTAGMPLDYLSKSDLERMKMRLETQVSKLNKEKSDHEFGLKDKQERLEQFESLYKEGVVSRRELESARREFADEQLTGSDLGDRFKDATLDLDRVKKQLSSLEKRQSKVSLKKSAMSSKENAHRFSGMPSGSSDELAVKDSPDRSVTTAKGATTGSTAVAPTGSRKTDSSRQSVRHP